MDRVFQRIIENNFSDFKGMTANASIPVPQYVVNEVMAAALEGNKTIDSCEVSIHPQNQVSMKLKTKLLPWTLHLKMKLDTSVDFASFGSPKVRAWLENNRLLGSLGAMLNALPEGVKLYGDQMVIDVGHFLPTPQEKRLLELVKSVDIHTEEGKVNLGVKVEVE
jgi:hypothetical protein